MNIFTPLTSKYDWKKNLQIKSPNPSTSQNNQEIFIKSNEKKFSTYNEENFNKKYVMSKNEKINKILPPKFNDTFIDNSKIQFNFNNLKNLSRNDLNKFDSDNLIQSNSIKDFGKTRENIITSENQKRHNFSELKLPIIK